ncbi:hypothetical protein [Variovorax sp. HW608]|uniref:hypothetical protein n=1 Tax=Variovorax sp. HW608 TaxID=1034889 RepID=UPI0012FE2370|nr:hypothetical protein [Variovorax sp. HW608]
MPAYRDGAGIGIGIGIGAGRVAGIIGSAAGAGSGMGAIDGAGTGVSVVRITPPPSTLPATVVWPVPSTRCSQAA